MRLSKFIKTNREAILAEWEAFARTLGPASAAMDLRTLRDHASEMLTVIVADLETPQTKTEQSEKAKGNSDGDGSGTKTAAEKHGADRAEHGFTIDQMVAEYRALRASVIRLWAKKCRQLVAADIEDLTRFNEAIDQALAESVTRYTLDLDHSKEMFLAILGHDLRTPLGAVIMSAQFMLETGDLQEPNRTLVSRILSSSKRMNRMVGDLLDFTRSRLGSGIPITRTAVNMEKLVEDIVDEMSAAYPGRKIQVSAEGSPDGEWDCPRISQALSNLIGNALEHGAAQTTVNLSIRDEGDAIAVAIHNQGAAIPAEQLSGIFNPMKRKDETGNTSSGPSGNLGLGLYIAERIVKAHEGSIHVESSERNGTRFTVHLPRAGSAQEQEQEQAPATATSTQ